MTLISCSLAALFASAIVLDGCSGSGKSGELDLNKPVYALSGAPFCRNELRLNELIEHVQAQNAKAPTTYDCFLIPNDGPVTVTETDAGGQGPAAKLVFDRGDGKNSEFFWTLLMFLRN
jgi:hypothetical protein